MRNVLLDTSFFIRFLNEDDPLFENADRYYQCFLQNNIALKCSTISIAEFCVRGHIDELPLKNLQIVPFNFFHAQRAGELARIVFENKGSLELSIRAIISNDTKLFAQADLEMIDIYITSDTESIKIYNLLKDHTDLHFQIIDLHNKHIDPRTIIESICKKNSIDNSLPPNMFEIFKEDLLPRQTV
ncbi:MAG: hypothetical protein ABH870_01985 [bacterium]